MLLVWSTLVFLVGLDKNSGVVLVSDLKSDGLVWVESSKNPLVLTRAQHRGPYPYMSSASTSAPILE
jgi:hypothetical protein